MEEIKHRETKYLKFELLGYSPSGKTKIFYVKNKKSNEIIAMIYWRNTWRKYVWTSMGEIDFDDNCTQDILDFVKDLMTEHKQKLKEEKNENTN